MSSQNRCLTSFNCHISEHCDPKTHLCVPNANVGDPCNRMAKIYTCGEGLRCNVVTGRCVRVPSSSWLSSVFELWSGNQHPANDCGKDDAHASPETIASGCVSMPCHSSLDCASNEFCGIFVDKNNFQVPFQEHPKEDGDYLAVRVVGPEATDKTFANTKGYCIRQRSLNQYCTSDPMCGEGLECDLNGSSKCLVRCFSNADCSRGSLYRSFPSFFNKSNQADIFDGECHLNRNSGKQFCVGFEKSAHKEDNVNPFPGLPSSPSNVFTRIPPSYFFFGSLVVLAISILVAIWCFCGDSGDDRLSRIRRQRREFVRLTRAGAVPASSSLFMDQVHNPPPSASFPWNNPSSKY